MKAYVRPHPCMHEKHVAMPCDTKWAVDSYDGRGKWIGTSMFQTKAEASAGAERIRKANRRQKIKAIPGNLQYRMVDHRP